MKKLTILSVLLLELAITSFGQSSKVTYSVASVADLSLRIPQPSEVIEVRHGSSSNLWPAPLSYTYVSNSTATVRFPYVRMPSTGVGRYESSAINNPVQDIRYWGAISGDGADDSASVQAALDWSAGNRRIFIPVGVWRFESPITLPYDYQEFDGGGFNANIQIAHNGNGFQHFGVTNGVPRRYNIIFRNIRMTTAAGFTPQSAFRLDDVSSSELDHVYVTQGSGVGFNRAVETFGHYDLDNAIYGGNWGFNISFCQLWNKAGGDYVVWGDGGPGSTGGPNDIRILNSYISGGLSGSPTNGAAGAVFLQNCNMVRVENCDFEQYSTNGVWIGTNVQSASILNNRFENQGGTTATRRLIHFDEYTTQGHVVMGNMMLIQGGGGSITRISGPGDSKYIPASIIDPSFEGPGQLFASTWLVGTNLDGNFRDAGPYGNKLAVMDRLLSATNSIGVAVYDGTNNPRAFIVLRDSGDGTGTNSRVDFLAASSKSSLPLYFLGSVTNAVITATGSSILGLPANGNAFSVYGSGMFGPDPSSPYVGGWSSVPNLLGIRSSDTNRLALFVGTIDGVENRRVQLIEDPVAKTVTLSHGYTTGGGATLFQVGLNVVMSMTDSLVTFPTNVVIMPGASITFGGVTRTDWPTGGGGTNSWKIEVNNAEVTEPSLDDTPTVSWDVTGSSIAAIVPTGSITTNHLNPAAIAFFASAANSALTGTPTVNGTNLMALLNAKIDSDPDLVAVSALTGTGLLARTGAGTYAERTLTGDAEITVANGNGVSGNPTLSIGAAIARVASMAATYQPLSAVLTQLATLNGSGLTNLNATTAFSSGTVPISRLASGTPDGTKFIRDDGTLVTPGGSGDATQSGNNSFTGTNAYTKTLVVSNQTANPAIVWVGTNTAGGTWQSGDIGTWDTGVNPSVGLRVRSLQGHLRIEVTDTNVISHTGFNFTNAPYSQWTFQRDKSNNGETYQEGRGPLMSAGSDTTEYYRLGMKSSGMYTVTGKGGFDWMPTNGYFRILGPGVGLSAPSAGEGLEFIYESTNALYGAGGCGRGAITVYDRAASLYGDLRINARNTRFSGAGTDVMNVSNALVEITGALKVGGTNVLDEVALKAPLASPALTGNPTVPTASAGDNDTSAASTAFVAAAVAVGNTNHTAGKTIASFFAPQAHAPASNPASYGTRNAIPVLEFDPSTQEQSRWVINLPVGYASSTATVVLRWTTTATSGDGRMGARFWKVTGVDVDADDFATAVEATTTCSATAGTTVATTLSAVNLDGLVGGEVGILEVYRDTGDAADTINSNDIQLLSVEVRAE